MKYLPYLLLPLGIAIGYFIPRPAPEQPSIVQPSPAPREQRPKPASASPEKAARIKALADSMTKNSTNYSEKPAHQTADIADIPAILDRLLSQVGPSGLSHQARWYIDQLLQRWAKEDFEGAYHWAKTHPNENARKDFLKSILKSRVVADYDGTLALVKSLKNDEGITLDMSSELFGAAIKRGAKQAFEALALCPSVNSGMTGSSTVFPKDFDFKTFAELAAQHAKVAENAPFSFFPSNLLESWAKTDATAAFDFYIENETLPFNDLGNITKAFLNIAEPASSYPWLQQQYESLTGEQRAKFAADLESVFPSEMGAAPLVNFANSIESPQIRENIVKDMLKSFGTMTRGGDDSYTYIDLLNVLPTPEKRLEAIHQSGMGGASASFPGQKLLELGITREQIEAMEKK